MERLFWENPYMREFDSVVSEIDGTRLSLEETAFFPESGGQAGDIGTLNGLQVLDTQYSKSGKKVFHVMDPAQIRELKKGSKVHGEIDWDRRFRIMKHHSALHLVYLVFEAHYGEHKIVGSEVRADKARVDFSYFGLAEAEVVEAKVNEIISEDRAIKTYASEEEPTRRFWEVEGFSKIPCGGTHVRSTGEIGPIHVKKKSLGAQGIRLYCSSSDI